MQMKANSNKCHLNTNKQSCMNLKIGNKNIENSTCEKLLAGKVDNILNFIKNVNGIVKKASCKSSALYLGFSLSLT